MRKITFAIEFKQKIFTLRYPEVKKKVFFTIWSESEMGVKRSNAYFLKRKLHQIFVRVFQKEIPE